MSSQDLIQIKLHQEFQAEKLTRTINECDDINVLKEIAIELIDLNQKNIAIAQWTLKKAIKAEESILLRKNILANN
tara:strand:- start:1636 stop:1863 length:228 start_codon:yes stop_codon:yes gene_type:complete